MGVMCGGGSVSGCGDADLIMPATYTDVVLVLYRSGSGSLLLNSYQSIIQT